MEEKKIPLRREYTKSELKFRDLQESPVDQFQAWFQEAAREEILEPNAMTLSTASSTGQPSSRIVLLKYFDAQGFVFFTNLESRKAYELKENPHAALNFFWRELERQVNIEGTATIVSINETLAYFSSRPRTSQIGAWASKQDAELESRDQLEQAYTQLTQYYEGKQIPLPPFWGGFRIRPNRFEFWQGRTNRLHDRFEYILHSPNCWKIKRLSP